MSNNQKTKINQPSAVSKVIKYHFKDLEIWIVSDGNVRYDNNCFAPAVPRSILKEMRNMPIADFILPHNIMLIISDKHRVMIDTGNGSGAQPEAGKLVEFLQDAGFDLETLTDIVLSHAHPDHINGLIDRNNNLVFPKATIHIHEQELVFWRNEQADFTKSKNNLETLIALQNDIREVLSLIDHKLKPFKNNEPLFDFLQPILTPGHTPGHCMFAVSTGKEVFIHLSDVFHDDFVLFEQPGWGTVFDIDFETAARTRQALLEEYSKSKQKIFGYHLPWPGFGYISISNSVYKWNPDSSILEI